MDKTRLAALDGGEFPSGTHRPEGLVEKKQMSVASAIDVSCVAHHYGAKAALDGVGFEVARGEIFGLLGPNGGGKTTLFRILSTLLPLQQGQVTILGNDLVADQSKIRAQIGVTFQSPSLDGKLTVQENLKHQGHLYGLAGRDLAARIDRLLEALALTDRALDRAESLSGGLKRRVEVAKGLLHDPEILLLDEPSTGLDPGARHDLWRYLAQLSHGSHVTVLVTTHLMEEAERCARLGILDKGRLVALGTPDELRASIGGDCLTIHSEEPKVLAKRIADRFSVNVREIAGTLRIEHAAGHELLRDVVAAFPGEVTSVSLGKPTLEDVFVSRTGHRFWNEQDEEPPEKKPRRKH